MPRQARCITPALALGWSSTKRHRYASAIDIPHRQPFARERVGRRWWSGCAHPCLSTVWRWNSGPVKTRQWRSEPAELHPLVVLCHSGRAQLPLADLASLAFSDLASAFVPPATLDQQNGSTLERKLTEGAAAHKPLLSGSGERLRQLDGVSVWPPPAGSAHSAQRDTQSQAALRASWVARWVGHAAPEWHAAVLDHQSLRERRGEPR